MKSEFWWYVARAGGIVAWALCAASVLWGLLLSGNRPDRAARRGGEHTRRHSAAKVRDLHEFLSGLAVVFAAVHGVGLLLDDTLNLSAVDVLVPWAANVDATGLAWGIVAFYLLVAIELTSLVRARVPEAVWRVTHLAALVVFLLSTVHGLTVGTDVENPLVWWPAAIASAAIVGLAVHRILSGDLLAALSARPASATPAATQPTNVTAALLERTLSELERLDTSSYPTAAPTTAAPPPPRPSAPPQPPAAPTPTPAPADMAAPAPMATPSATQPSARDAEPMFPGISPTAPASRIGEERDAPRRPPVPSRAPAADPSRSTLPTRVPQRLAATTAPAATLGAWAPAAGTTKADGPPPPPENAVDPETGEPDPHAYRKWLRDWLEYVESQP